MASTRDYLNKLINEESPDDDLQITGVYVKIKTAGRTSTGMLYLKPQNTDKYNARDLALSLLKLEK